jgi:hypothetical protein
MTDLEIAARKLLAKRNSIETDISSAHSNRGAGASSWMREDDRDFRNSLSQVFDDIAAALLADQPTNPRSTT